MAAIIGYTCTDGNVYCVCCRTSIPVIHATLGERFSPIYSTDQRIQYCEGPACGQYVTSLRRRHIRREETIKDILDNADTYDENSPVVEKF